MALFSRLALRTSHERAELHVVSRTEEASDSIVIGIAQQSELGGRNSR